MPPADDPTADPRPADHESSAPRAPRPRSVEGLLELIRTLRGPAGCPWDREQSLESSAPHVLEECHELAAALSNGDSGAIVEELGDVLFQVCFVAALLEEDGTATLASIAERQHAKMVERHPHVFERGEELASADQVERAWSRKKLRDDDRTVLGGLPASLPALSRALRMGQRAAAVGFDWDDPTEVLSKVEEELGELAESLGEGDDDGAEEELGDLLFALSSLARHRRIDPERALQRANQKFARRFAAVEAVLAKEAASGREVAAAGARPPDPELRARMEAAWNQVKDRERGEER